MKTGTVRLYNGQNGFCFIRRDNSDQDVFVHAGAPERAGLQSHARDKRSVTTLTTIRAAARSPFTRLIPPDAATSVCAD